MKKIFILIIGLLVLTDASAQFFSDALQPDLWWKQDTKENPSAKNLEATGLINFNETILFDGSAPVELPFEVDDISRITFLCVFQSADISREMGVWGTRNSRKAIMLTTQQVSGPRSVLSYEGGNVAIPVLNTTVQYWGNTVAGDHPAYIVIGNAGEHGGGIAPFQGMIPEYLIFKRVLRKDVRRQLETYLALKYGITLQGVDYLNSQNKVVWDYEKNKAYSYRIAGIGRDDILGLYQKQSTSTVEPEFLTIGAGRIAASNKLNTAELNELDFLVWGDNGEPFALQQDPGSSGKTFCYFNRRWLMEVAGATASDMTTEVQVDLAEVTIPKGYKPWLIIDRSGKGNFSLASTLEYVSADLFSEQGVASFPDVHWDNDYSGSDAFAFALGPDNLPAVAHFNVFPNPSGGDFRVDIALKEILDIHLRIYRVDGQILKEMVGEGQDRYQFSGFIEDSGVYLIKLETPQGSVSQELIITK